LQVHPKSQEDVVATGFSRFEGDGLQPVR